MKQLLMIVPFFPPIAGGGVYRPLGFVRNLESYGWRPTVIAPSSDSFWIKDAQLLDDVPSTCEVHRTKTLSGLGDETLTDGSTVTIVAAFLKRGFAWRGLPQGEQDDTDGYVIANDTITINKNDKISVDGQDFIVRQAVVRFADTTNAVKVYTYCILKLEVR